VQQSIELVHRRRVDRLRTTFLDHELTIATFWAHLVALLRTTQAQLQRWIPERDIRSRKIRVYDYRAQRWIPVLPDAVFLVHYPDGFLQTCYLEVDTGTLPLRRFQQKLRAFESEEGPWLRSDRTPEDFEVLVLTRSRPRLNQLRRVTHEVVEANRLSSYLFATSDLLDIKEFGEDRWITTGGQWTPLLYDGAFPEQSADGDAEP